jgi:hypothetical protein
MGLDGIQPEPEEDGVINRYGARGSTHVPLGKVVQLDPLRCEPVLPIELILQGTAIELGARDGFVHNCENSVYDVSLYDPKLVEVQLRYTNFWWPDVHQK